MGHMWHHLGKRRHHELMPFYKVLPLAPFLPFFFAMASPDLSCIVHLGRPCFAFASPQRWSRRPSSCGSKRRKLCTCQTCAKLASHTYFTEWFGRPFIYNIASCIGETPSRNPTYIFHRTDLQALYLQHSLLHRRNTKQESHIHISQNWFGRPFTYMIHLQKMKGTKKSETMVPHHTF